MKKLIITSAALLASLSLVGCHTTNDVAQFSNNTVGKGVQYGAKTVGAGVGVVSNTGAFVGRSVGTVVGTGVGVVGSGVGMVTGQKTYHNNMNSSYKTKGVVYHKGHYYKMQHGKYVLVR